MIQRDHVEESLHYLMIDVLVDSLEKDGYTVHADHVGGLRPKPRPLGDYIPDIEAAKGSDIRLIEVETQSTIATPETRTQLLALIAADARAYLAVPFDCLEEARQLREELETDFIILPCYPFVRYIGIPK